MITFLERWWRQPQKVFLRRALFQIHLWSGIGVGLYMLAISLSGSAIVFRVELAKKYDVKPPPIPVSGTPIPMERLTEIAQRAYPGYEIARAYPPKTPDRAAEFWFERGGARTGHLFNPYTGEDLGNVVPLAMRTLTWLVKLHDELLGGSTGRKVNGAGGLLLMLLSLTGIVIWWPGVKNWRRSLGVRRTGNWKQFNWDLHSMIGFWMMAFVLMWAFTGFYLGFQESFGEALDYFQPYDENVRGLRSGERLFRTFQRLHFGRNYGTSVKWLWVVLGAAPAVLFVTGAIMWWNRVLRRWVAAMIPSRASGNGRELEGARS